MKVILTGVTGFIGNEALLQCLASPKITSIIALSRRALPSTIPQDPKLKVLILEDFTNYPPEVLAQLAGAEACIWTLGVKNADIETCRKVSVDYTVAAISAFSQLGKQNKKPFRFVFMSGFLAVRDQTTTLLFLQEGRRLKGQAETALLVANEEKKDALDSYVLRPAGVVPKGRSLRSIIQGMTYSIGVAELAASSLDLALNGSKEKERLIENNELVRKGKAILAQRK